MDGIATMVNGIIKQDVATTKYPGYNIYHNLLVTLDILGMISEELSEDVQFNIWWGLKDQLWISMLDDWDHIQMEIIGESKARVNRKNVYNSILWVMDRLGMVEELRCSNIFWTMRYSERAAEIVDEK